jgi:polygalacturonase
MSICLLHGNEGMEVKVHAATVSNVSYTVNNTFDPVEKQYQKRKTFTTKSKNYYMLRSYLELLEKKGGGTLILSAGTYEICNTLYVASNITIILEDGVVIRKIEDTGTESMKSSFSLFQLVAPSKSKIRGVYSAYDGESSIRLLGEGNATIDMNYVSGAIGIIFAHNSGITVSGINFTNMQSGHFLELDASRNVIIENNTFSGHRPSRSGIKEAINLDTPDRSTGGIHVGWTSYDQTPNLEVVIRNNRFSNLERAIGTHKYSEGKYHENIQILNNTIENTVSDAIRIINWRTPTITGNIISNVKEGSGTERAILASGLIHPDIRDNTFKNVARPIQLMPWKNNGAGGEYNITYNEVDYSEIEVMLQNILEQVREPFIRVNQVHNVFNASTLRYYYSAAYKR